MKINLVVSDDLYKSAYDTLQLVKVNSENNLIIVPDRFSLLAEKMIFDATKCQCMLNTEVIGLNGLARRINEELNIKTNDASELISMLFVKKALEEVKEKLTIFKKDNYSFGFCQSVYKIISLIESSKVTSDKLIYYGENKNLKEKVHDIQIILNRYIELLDDKNDSSKTLIILLDNLDKSQFIKDCNIYFVGFDSLTSLGQEVLMTLTKVSKSVTISLVKANVQPNDYIYETDLYDKVSALSKLYGVSIEVIENNHNDDELESFLRKNLFAPATSKYDAKNRFMVYRNLTRDDEVLTVAKEIKYRVYNGDRYNNFNLGLSNLDNYKSLIDKIFTECNIPYYIDCDESLYDTMIAKYYLSYLEMLKSMEYAKIGNFLSSTYQNTQAKYFTLLDKFKPNNIYECSKYSELYDNLKEYIDLSKLLRGKHEISEMIDLTKSILKVDDEMIISKIEFSYPRESMILREAKDKLLDTLLELKEIYQDKITLGDYIDILKFAFKSVKLSSVPIGVDSVYIGDITKSFFSKRKYMYVLGAESNYLPEYIKDYGLISDRDIDSLNAVFQLSPTVKMINRRNRFRVFCNSLRFSDSLVFSYNLEDGNLASFIVDAMIIFSIQEVDMQRRRYLFDDEMFLFELASFNEATKLLYDDTIDARYINSLYQSKILPIEEYLHLQNVDRNLINNKVKVTQIEKYFCCPYAHYLIYGLKVKEKPTKRLLANEYGSFMHTIVKEYISNSNEEFEKIFMQNIKKLDKFNYLDVITKKFLFHEASSICNLIKYELENSNFKPLYLEKRFEVNLNETNLVGIVDRIDIYGDYFRIIDYKTGKTQPILKDLYYGNKIQLFLYAKVISKIINKKCAGVFYFNADLSYKDKEEYLLKGEYLHDNEIILSLDSRIRENKKSDIVKAQVSSKSTTNNIIFTDKSGITQEELNDLIDYSEKIMQNALNEIKVGCISINPTKDECQYCKFKSVCRFNGIGRKNDGKISNKSFKE